MDTKELAEKYAYPEATPWLRANMVASLDGAAWRDGKAGPLGSELDQHILTLLRGLSDVVIVGANTIRVEGYGPLPPQDSWQGLRQGRPPAPPLAIVSARLDLDFDAPVFTEAYVRPIVITCESAPQDRRRAAERHADVIVAGELIADVGAALDVLAERGHVRQLCEGGPRLLAAIAAVGRLDELCLTLSPQLTSGDAARILNGPVMDAIRMRLGHVIEEENFLFLRYVTEESARRTQGRRVAVGTSRSLL